MILDLRTGHPRGDQPKAANRIVSADEIVNISAGNAFAML